MLSSKLLRVSLTLLSKITGQINCELDSLKEKSVLWQKIWESIGCPKGLLLRIKTKATLNFKLVVKQAAVNFESSHSQDMHQHFLNKNIPMSGGSLGLGNGAVMWCNTFEYLGIHRHSF